MPDNRDYPESLRLTSFRQSVNEGVPSAVTNTEYNYSWVNFMHGVQNYGWKDAIKNMTPATTNADGIKVEFLSSPFIHSVVHGWYPAAGLDKYQFYTGSPNDALPYAGFPNSTVPPSVVTNVTNRCTTQFLERAQSALSSFESGQDLGELKQTIESIIHPMKSLRQHVLSYFSSIKKLKSRYKKVTSLRKAVADTYLEWTFGWKPLAADIADGIVGLSNQRLPNVPISAFAKSKFQHDVRTDSVSAPSLGNYDATSLVTGEYSMRLKGVVNAYFDGPQPSLQQELRLLPRDFLPTAWDLLPYSFVADYFLNIGDIISAFSFPSAAIRWVNQSSQETNRILQTYKAGDLSFYYPPPNWQSSHDFAAVNLEILVTRFSRRNVYASTLIPVLQFNLPFSSKPWENIAALIAGGKKSLVPLW